MSGSQGREHRRNLARVGAALDRFVAAHGGRSGPATRSLDERFLAPPTRSRRRCAGSGRRVVATVIPNGARLASPGFSGWITTGPTPSRSSPPPPPRWPRPSATRSRPTTCWRSSHSNGSPSCAGSANDAGRVLRAAVGREPRRARRRPSVGARADGDRSLHDGSPASRSPCTRPPRPTTPSRAAAVLGIGRSRVRVIAADGPAHARDLLREAIETDVAAGAVPVAVVATAGTTNTGAIDPLREAGEVAREHGPGSTSTAPTGCPADWTTAWRRSMKASTSPIPRSSTLTSGLVHRSGSPPRSYATAPSSIAPSHRSRPRIEGAFDPEGEDAMSLDSPGVPYTEFAVELSAPSRGAVVWSILRVLGRDGVRQDPPRQRLRRAAWPITSAAISDSSSPPSRFSPSVASATHARHAGSQRVQHGPAAQAGPGDAAPPELDGRQRHVRDPPVLHQCPHRGEARRRPRRRRRLARRRDVGPER